MSEIFIIIFNFSFVFIFNTGVTFYSEVGCMTMGPKGSHYLSATEENCKSLNINFQNCSQYDVRSLFPYLRSGPNRGYLYTRKRSGYISPRKLITAQKTAAHLQGCEIISDTVTVVNSTSEGGQKSVCITTKNGSEVYANRVLLCTGAFTNFHGLLEEVQKLEIKVESEMVVKSEVSGKELAKLKDMPVMISFTGVLPDVEDFYLLPPIQYPNGKFEHRRCFFRFLSIQLCFFLLFTPRVSMLLGAGSVFRLMHDCLSANPLIV